MKWTGAVVVSEAYEYEVEADSYEQAQAKIEDIFRLGGYPDKVHTLDCYVENLHEKKEEDEA